MQCARPSRGIGRVVNSPATLGIASTAGHHCMGAVDPRLSLLTGTLERTRTRASRNENRIEGRTGLVNRLARKIDLQADKEANPQFISVRCYRPAER